ncbi:CDK-activating kinase assembly factor MAT1 [Pelomyxa schiedti]|nr:CDK-activating kinase assembly factor MAT1 [Pelomyxa schiedti]
MIGPKLIPITGNKKENCTRIVRPVMLNRNKGRGISASRNGARSSIGGQNVVGVSDGEWDKECAACHSCEFVNRNIQFMVSNVCNHVLCMECWQRNKGITRCPKCNLESVHYSQMDQAQEISKENATRRTMSKIFCKTRAEFPSLLEYNNYLEESEDIIYNMVHEINLDDARGRVNAYKVSVAQSNVSAGASSSQKPSRAVEVPMQLNSQISSELQEMEERKRQSGEEPVAPSKRAPGALPSTGGDQKKYRVDPYPSTPAVQAPPRPASTPMPRIQNIVPSYVSSTPMPTMVVIDRRRELSQEEQMQIQERAGGYTPQYALKRDIEEAFQALWLVGW